MPKTTHKCPARPCPLPVPDRLLACPKHWFQLPSAVRQEIHVTARLPLTDPRRRAALDKAYKVWGVSRGR
jgi:hypothetical protein